MNRQPLYPAFALAVLVLTLVLAAPVAAERGPDAAVAAPAAETVQKTVAQPAERLDAPLVPLAIPTALVLHCDEAPKGRIPCEECPASCIYNGEEVPCECETFPFLGDICFCPA